MAGRRRRTPEQARAEILSAAERRLREHGVDGLNLVDVAAAAGMSHATVLHHFGSTAGMRQALVAHMTDRLLVDILAALQARGDGDGPAVVRHLFETLSAGGHVKLLAWLSVAGSELNEGAGPSSQVAQRFAELIRLLAARLGDEAEPERAARRVVLLIAATAIGFGVGGATLQALIGLDASEADAFPDWFGREVLRLMGQLG
ncbi:MAG: TetR/AcrR family transcriptional regulator, partial [Pseudomonadales bacterium]|nr:TetR/AcrR family transcriptional regulator [Pseudomonadales bacterium]